VESTLRAARTDPHADDERLVVEPPDQPSDVAAAVAVGVGERVDVEAIDDGLLIPPIAHGPYMTCGAATETPAAALTKVRARKGDTIARIAAARNLDANEVARLNGVTPEVELRAGQEVRLPATAAAVPSRRR